MMPRRPARYVWRPRRVRLSRVMLVVAAVAVVGGVVWLASGAAPPGGGATPPAATSREGSTGDRPKVPTGTVVLTRLETAPPYAYGVREGDLDIFPLLRRLLDAAQGGVPRLEFTVSLEETFFLRRHIERQMRALADMPEPFYLEYQGLFYRLELPPNP